MDDSTYLWWTLILSSSIGGIFVFVIFYGAPYLPSRRSQVIEALDMLDMQTGQTLIELGSGDGRVLLEAAKRGICCIGYELNPILMWYSRLATYRYRHLVTVRCKNFWIAPLPECDAVYTFLMKPYMKRFETKLQNEISKPIKALSVSFSIDGKKASQTNNGLFLYTFKPLD
jgi:hypothetical protein